MSMAYDTVCVFNFAVLVFGVRRELPGDSVVAEQTLCRVLLSLLGLVPVVPGAVVRVLWVSPVGVCGVVWVSAVVCERVLSGGCMAAERELCRFRLDGLETLESAYVSRASSGCRLYVSVGL